MHRRREILRDGCSAICCASAVARNAGRKAHEIGLSTAARLALAAQRSERFGTKLHRWERKSPEKVPEFSRRSLTVHSCRRSVAGARHEPLSRSPLPVLAFRFPVPRSSVLRQGENTRIAVIAVLGCLVAWPRWANQSTSCNPRLLLVGDGRGFVVKHGVISAVARVWVKPGAGNIVINTRDVETSSAPAWRIEQSGGRPGSGAIQPP